MEIESFVPMESPGVLSAKRGVLVLKGEGCGLEGCHCSDGFLLSVSDGKHGILVRFKDKKEMAAVLRGNGKWMYSEKVEEVPCELLTDGCDQQGVPCARCAEEKRGDKGC